MKCKNCGEKIDSGKDVCPSCGEAVEAADESNRVTPAKIIFVIVAFFLLVGGGVAAHFILGGKPLQNTSEKAVSLIQAGEYEQAYSLYEGDNSEKAKSIKDYGVFREAKGRYLKHLSSLSTGENIPRTFEKSSNAFLLSVESAMIDETEEGPELTLKNWDEELRKELMFDHLVFGQLSDTESFRNFKAPKDAAGLLALPVNDFVSPLLDVVGNLPENEKYEEIGLSLETVLKEKLSKTEGVTVADVLSAESTDYIFSAEFKGLKKADDASLCLFARDLLFFFLSGETIEKDASENAEAPSEATSEAAGEPEIAADSSQEDAEAN